MRWEAWGSVRGSGICGSGRVGWGRPAWAVVRLGIAWGYRFAGEGSPSEECALSVGGITGGHLGAWEWGLLDFEGCQWPDANESGMSVLTEVTQEASGSPVPFLRSLKG